MWLIILRSHYLSIMFQYYIFACKANLSDYLTLADFMAKNDVDNGFLIMDRATHIACLGVQLDEDSDINPADMLPQHTTVMAGVLEGDDKLDQPFGIEEGLFMSMLSCDLVQTKNLADVRSSFARRLGIKLEPDRVIVNK